MTALSSDALARPLGRLRRAARHKVVRDTGWTMATELAGMASQLGTLLLVGRAFREDVYGLFAGTVALLNVLSPFTTVGMGYVLVQRVAGRRADAGAEAGRAWTTVAVGGAGGIAGVVLVSRVLVPGVPIAAIVALGVGELVCSQITYVGRFLAQAVDRPADGARIVASVWLLRLVTAATYFGAGPRPTLVGWAVFHAGASLLGAAITLVACRRVLGVRARAGLADPATVREGLGFSLSIGAIYLKNDADKTLLLSFHQSTAAGLYGLASRVITPLYAPVRALADSTFSRFFRDGTRDTAAAYRLARRTTVAGALLTLAGGVVIACAAPLLPVLVGDTWQPAVVVTQLLAFVPMLIALQMYAFNALMGLGRRRACMTISVAASLTNLGLNLVLIPRFDWRGATAATAVAETVSVVALWTVLRREAQRAARPGDGYASRSMQETYASTT